MPMFALAMADDFVNLAMAESICAVFAMQESAVSTDDKEVVIADTGWRSAKPVSNRMAINNIWLIFFILAFVG